MGSPLPAVDALVREAACEAPHALCVREARATLAERRARGQHATAAELAPELRRRVRAALEPSLRPVLNATGVVLHTNLGRAPLAGAALAHVAAVAGGYSNLELDLATGGRGSRQDHVSGLVCELTGAEAALCVNNGAAALVLALAALAGGREIVVSRGQLVEIGDGFRIPEIVESAGAQLREVGTTNRTRPSDYAQAFGARTGAVLCVHPSNYRVLGFTGGVEARELATLAHGAGLPLIYDVGSGALLDEPALAGEPLARDGLRDGADLVCFSGDKLLGGPQAGILAGSADAIAACRRHPLARALRIDKLSLAALEATLRIYRDPARARAELPVLRAVLEPADDVRARAEALAARIGGTVVATVARVGGGALPLAELPSFGVRLEGDADELAARLRAGDPAVLARVADGALVLDCRTLGDAEAARIAAPA
ncbi:MAG TPA: L-seryl-tRNA(Sec) selenium transferase [Gaiellales bacterium]